MWLILQQELSKGEDLYMKTSSLGRLFRAKLSITLLIVCLLGGTLFSFEQVSANGAVQVYVDGKEVHFSDVQPIVKDGRTLVPVRAIVDAMGAKTSWNGSQQRAEISLNHRKAHFILNLPYVQKYQTANQATYSHILEIDTPAQLVQNRTMVPLRAVGEALGYRVGWDARTQTATYQKGNPTTTFKQYGVVGDISKLQQKELEVFFQTNQEREAQGAKALSLHVNLSAVAQEKSRDMHNQQYFDHTSPTYGSPFDMMRAFGISFQAAGENIAAGYRTSGDVMTGWMNSEGHRKNILSSNFSYIGVGYHHGQSGYNHYWTQMFMR